MIYENNVKIIVMLCELIEGNRSKCHQYWSNKNKLKAFTLQMNEENKISSYLTVRSFALTRVDIEGGEERLVTQLHFTGWPDHGVPNISKVYDTFAHMIKEVDAKFGESVSNSNLNSTLISPVVVHCSAGIGRTGTFISMYALHRTINSQKGNDKVTFNIWNTVRKIKEMRLNSVENILQYKFIYSFVQKYLQNFFK
jgi:protein tyrosine phosphatase